MVKILYDIINCRIGDQGLVIVVTLYPIIGIGACFRETRGKICPLKFPHL